MNKSNKQKIQLSSHAATSGFLIMFPNRSRCVTYPKDLHQEWSTNGPKSPDPPRCAVAKDLAAMSHRTRPPLPTLEIKVPNPSRRVDCGSLWRYEMAPR